MGALVLLIEFRSGLEFGNETYGRAKSVLLKRRTKDTDLKGGCVLIAVCKTASYRQTGETGACTQGREGLGAGFCLPLFFWLMPVPIDQGFGDKRGNLRFFLPASQFPSP